MTAPESRHLADTCWGPRDKKHHHGQHVLGTQRSCPKCVVACVKDDERQWRAQRPGWPARLGARLRRSIGWVCSRARRVEA